MAYVFNKLANQLGAEEGKQNIFGLMGQPEQGQGGGGPALKLTGEGGGEAGAGSPAVKDTGEGDAERSASLQSGAQQSLIGSLNQPAKAETGQVYGNVGETIKSREQQLKDEASRYQQQAQAATTGDFYGEAGEVRKKVEGALGDQQGGGYGQLRSFISGEAKPQVQQYQSGVQTGDIRIPQSQSDIAESLQRSSQRPTYTAGQARLDAALLGGTQQFQSEQARLRDEKERLEGQRIRAQQAADEQARQAQERYTSQQGVVRDVLGSLADEMIAQQQAERDQAASYAPDEEALRRAYEQALTTYTGSPGFDYGTYSDVVDPSQYYSRSATEYASDPLAYLDATERSRYNQLMDLLGRSQVAGEYGPTYTEGFDVGGYQQAIAAEQSRLDQERQLEEQRKTAEALANRNSTYTPEGIIGDEMKDAFQRQQERLAGVVLDDKNAELYGRNARKAVEAGEDWGQAALEIPRQSYAPLINKGKNKGWW